MYIFQHFVIEKVSKTHLNTVACINDDVLQEWNNYKSYKVL